MGLLTDHFPTDRIRLEKRDGRTFDDIVAVVQPTSVLIERDDLPIEEGDTLIRNLPTGTVERYEITRSAFYGQAHALPAHYQLKVRKIVAGERPADPRSVVYNLSGPHARVNIGSHDHSMNISITADELFADMSSVVKQKISDSAKQQEVLAAIERMKTTRGDKAGFGEAYLKFMAAIADHIAVFQPFLIPLGSMLADGRLPPC